MKDYLCLNKNYSTTRRLIQHRPVAVAKTEKAELGTTLFPREGEGRQGEGGLRSKGYFKKNVEKIMMFIIDKLFGG